MRKSAKSLLLLIPIVIPIFFFYQVSAEAGLNWIDDVIFLDHKSADGRSYGCIANNYDVTRIENDQLINDGYYGCIVEGKDFDYLVHSFTRDANSEASVYAIRVKGGDIFQRIRTDNVSLMYYRESDTFIESRGSDTENHVYSIYPSSLNKFVPVKDINGAIAEYKINSGDYHTEIPIDSTITTPTLSVNGQFMVVQYRKNNKEFIAKIDTKTGATTKAFIMDTDDRNRILVRAVSDNGRWIYVEQRAGNRTIANRFVYDGLSCVVETDSCVRRDLKSAYTGDFEYSLDSWTEEAEFSDDDRTLTFWGTSGDRYVLSLIPTNDERLEYLALGDSFSSGEGDIERDAKTKLKTYREHTDDDGTLNMDGSTEQIHPKEKCHLSTNSYPYHLALGMELGVPTNDSKTTKWQSVACSGATSWDIKEQGSAEYKGQNDDTYKPRLEKYDFATLKNQSLNEFIPGRQKQIEFVKKYQPKVITLTAGGNDINFGGKMIDCVLSRRTCDYASEEWRVKLKNEIYGQFDSLSLLYGELRDATDGQSKIYAIGYPVYINANPAAKCSPKLLFLNLEEREMIVNSILYLNNVIQAAAKKAGVTYVDIEHAFGNHRLCDDGASHVNAVVGILGYRGDELQESFHPNKKGHVDMTNAIWDFVGGASLLDYATCPGSGHQKATCPNVSIDANDAVMPPYFLGGNENDRNTIVRYYTLTNGVLMKSVKHNGVKTDESWFEPESKVDVTLYSTPTHLGKFTTDHEGNLTADITIPAKISAGYHRLSITGMAVDGRPIEVYQTVLVQGLNENDLDEDGVLDREDRCAYGLPVDDDVNVESGKGCSGESVNTKVRDVDVFMESDLHRGSTAKSLFVTDSADSHLLIQPTTQPHFSTDIKTGINQPHVKSTSNTLFVILASIVILFTAAMILYSKWRQT